MDGELAARGTYLFMEDRMKMNLWFVATLIVLTFSFEQDDYESRHPITATTLHLSFGDVSITAYVGSLSTFEASQVELKICKAAPLTTFLKTPAQASSLNDNGRYTYCLLAGQ